MAFPVRPMVRSRLLEGQSNGQLDGDILTTTPGQAGGPTVVLVKPAARAWRALCAAARAAGHTLKATSIADSYRLYSIQERIFRERYTTKRLAGRPSKVWNGRRWWQRPGTAVAAVPGTSIHGWASAVDTGEERDSDAGTESLDDPTLRWLLANEERFGWSHEVQSEPWHLRYFAGDDIPQAVLDYEASLDTDPPPDDEEDDVAPAFELWRDKRNNKLYRVAADGCRKVHVPNDTVAAIDYLRQGSGAEHIADQPNEQKWLDSVPTATP